MSYLINNILIGNGVTTSNHNFTGDSSQIGYFTDSIHSIGFSEGFILSTGNIDSIGNKMIQFGGTIYMIVPGQILLILHQL